MKTKTQETIGAALFALMVFGMIATANHFQNDSLGNVISNNLMAYKSTNY